MPRPPRRQQRRAVIVGGAALAAASLGAGAASPARANDAGSVTDSAGQVSATIEWDKADYGIANPRLHVERAGVRYDVTIVDVCDEGCIVVQDDGDDRATSAVKVADLDGDGEPEVLVDTFSGGAHCCLTARVLTWNGSGYTPTDIDYRDVSYAVKDADGDGRPELVGQDPVFSAAFTAFAASAFPPLVYHVEHGKLVDVTRTFPKLVRADAAALLKDLRKAKRGDDVRGILAAYVADQYLLGKGATGKAEIERQRRKGRVTKSFGPYVLKKLKAWHYR
jgi:hypothetical protein